MRCWFIPFLALFLAGCTAPRTPLPFGPPPGPAPSKTAPPGVDARTLDALTWLEAARGTTDEDWRTERVQRIDALHVAHPELTQATLNDVGDLLDHVRQMTVADYENQKAALMARLQGDVPSL